MYENFVELRSIDLALIAQPKIYCHGLGILFFKTFLWDTSPGTEQTDTFGNMFHFLGRTLWALSIQIRNSKWVGISLSIIEMMVRSSVLKMNLNEQI